jgi:hypothetical protein
MQEVPSLIFNALKERKKFHLRLFIDVGSTAQVTQSLKSRKHERCASKDLKRDCYDLLDGITLTDSWRDTQKHKINRVAGNPFKIQTGNHQNTGLEHYRYEKFEAINKGF